MFDQVKCWCIHWLAQCLLLSAGQVKSQAGRVSEMDSSDYLKSAFGAAAGVRCRKLSNVLLWIGSGA